MPTITDRHRCWGYRRGSRGAGFPSKPQAVGPVHSSRRRRDPTIVTTTSQEVTTEERLRHIDALDLEPIVYKLMHPEPGHAALSLAEADQDVALYRCFLKLCVLHPTATIVPTRQLDHVWHTHMLDTAKYRADCDLVFGHFMDHFPYAGLRGEEDRRAWRDDFAQTRRLFRRHFGVNIGSQPAASACRNHGDVSDCCVGCIKPPAADARPRPDRSTAVTPVRA
jgi:hypothetical protein